jgi:hypothetical protein
MWLKCNGRVVAFVDVVTSAAYSRYAAHLLWLFPLYATQDL